MKKSSSVQLRNGVRAGNSRQWIGAGLSGSLRDLAVVHKLRQVEIGFGPSEITQTHQVWLGLHFSEIQIALGTMGSS